MGYSRGTSNYLERITLSNRTHMMSMADLVAIGVEIVRIDSRCYLEKEFTELIRMNPLIVIIPNCQSGLFMTWLRHQRCMCSFNLRHQRYLVDG